MHIKIMSLVSGPFLPRVAMGYQRTALCGRARPYPVFHQLNETVQSSWYCDVNVRLFSTVETGHGTSDYVATRLRLPQPMADFELSRLTFDFVFVDERHDLLF